MELNKISSIRTFFSLFLVFTLLLPCFSAGDGADSTFVINSVPENIDDFVAFRDETADSPEGGVAVFLLAMIIYTKNEALGLQCFTVALDRYHLTQTSKDGYKGYKPNTNFMYFINRLKERPYLPLAYIMGTAADDGYKTELPYTIGFKTNTKPLSDPELFKIFIITSGPYYPRPITLKKNDRGIWKVYEASSLFVDVTPPVQNDGDDI